MVDTTISSGNVQPGTDQGVFGSLRFLNKGCQFALMFCHSRNSREESFCISALRYPFETMCFSHLSFRIPENSLLIVDVTAIGLKFEGFSLDALFPMSLKTAFFQLDGTVPSAIIPLNKSNSTGTSEGHFLKI